MIPGVVNIEFLTPELAAKLSASQGQMAMAEHVLAAAASGKGSAAAATNVLTSSSIVLTIARSASTS